MKIHKLVVLLIVASGCSRGALEQPSADFSGLSDGWNEITPGGETACANGDAFVFNFRPGSETDLTVFLSGGGACSSFETCDLENGMFNPGILGGNLVDNRTQGVFDFDNIRNPIAGHSVLFVPYCTGDVHLGDAVVDYTSEDGAERTVPHVGYTNAMAAMEWLYDRVKSPSRIAVIGESAGAIATPLFAGILADHYPEARINQLGDGAGAYQGAGVTEALRTWQGGDLFEQLDWFRPYVTDSTEFTTLYTAVSAEFDRVRLHQYNTESDSVQVLFMRVGSGAEPNLPELIDSNLARLAAADPNFRSYTMTGFEHTILGRDELYEDARYPTPLVDWITAVIEGRSVESIRVRAE